MIYFPILSLASITDEYCKVDLNAESSNELNYRIVTGATPRPESPSGYSISFWTSTCNVNVEKDVNRPILRDKSRRSSNDGYKIKYRRNRLRQKLRELRSKALKLSHEMTVRSNDADTSLQRATRLRQMMNCYEKQIENVSKLLCKLSASISPISNDIVDLDHENELDEEHAVERAAIDSNSVTQMVNGISATRQQTSFSPLPSPSPSPPKLSPLSPIDYNKSPDKVRDSPPVLPRVYITIQPTTLECMKQNLVSAKNWHGGGDDSSSSSIKKAIKLFDNTDRTIIHSEVRNESITRISPVSSSEFDSPGNSTAEWDTEDTLPKLSPTLKSPEIEQKTQKNTKTFEDVDESERSTLPVPSNDFLNSTINTGIDRGGTKDMKETASVQESLDEVAIQAAEAQAANEQVAREKQEEKQEQNRSSEALPTSSLILEEAKKNTEHTTYESEERANSECRTVASTSTTTQEASTVIGRPQVVESNITNILQLQSDYYSSSAAQDNIAFTDVMRSARSAQKVSNLESHFQVTDVYRLFFISILIH